MASEGDLEIVGKATGVQEALKAIGRDQPDVVIIGGTLADGHGREVLLALQEQRSATRSLVFSADATEESIALAMELGASAYLAKSTERSELLDVVKKVAAGAIYLPPEFEASLQRRRRRPALTDRELAVLQWVATGEPNKMIGANLGISETTVKVHLSRVFEKLGVHDRISATITALRRGLVRLDR